MRMLFVTMNTLNGIKNGGNQCTTRNLQLMRSIYGKENVDICAASKNDGEIVGEDGNYTIQLMKSRIWQFLSGLILHIDLTRKSIEFLYKLARREKYEVIFFDNTRLGRIIKKLKRDKVIKSKVIVFAHNVEKDILWQRVKNENILCLPLYFATAYCEKLSIKYSDLLFSLSKRDGKVFETIYYRKPDYVVPITFTDQYKTELKEYILPERSLVFVGSEYMPNVKGIRWFCRKVMPFIDGVKLYILGSGMEKLRDELENEKIEVIGTVDSLSTYLVSAGAVVMPIFYGSGMKVKTAEAIMYGKRIFATEEALAGYEIADKGMTQCGTAEEFIESIGSYFEIEGVERKIKEVRELFEKYYNTDVYIEPLRKLLGANNG